jgi:hypothetical protein
MSTFDDAAGGQITEDGKLSDSTVTTIFTAVGATWIHAITATENNGGTPTLSIEKYTGSVSYYIRRAVAMAAGTQVVYDNGFLLPAGWSIRLTSNDAGGDVDWSITYDSPAAAKLRA